MKIDRRHFISFFAGTALAATTFPVLLYAKTKQSQQAKMKIDLTAIEQAEKLAGLAFTSEERELLREGLEDYLASYQELRKVPIPNHVPPAFSFRVPPPTGHTLPRALEFSPAPVKLHDSSDLSFMPVYQLAYLLWDRQISSVELTKFFLNRIKKHDPALEAVITVTEERALREAQRCDQEMTQGHCRGPLHGIPYGVKDLFTTEKYPTTWGAAPYQKQLIEEDATVVQKLQQAGAVLIGKLSSGALAWGDVWFGGKTKNPWNLQQGSSGSSAGPASAVAAGLMPFAIGTETWGSIVSPATRCGTTGLRPTFGRVSRYGCMALSWTMDKVGPIARTVDDCALVFRAIEGEDGKDQSVQTPGFVWPAAIEVPEIKLGYLKTAFANNSDSEWQKLDWQVVHDLQQAGLVLEPVSLPDYPISSLSFILQAEAAAAFDELTRSDRDELLIRQGKNTWPNVFRQARFIPAVEYIQANRIRSLLVQKMAELFQKVDVYLSPTYGEDNLLLTNLTGHPSVVLPNGFAADGTPRSITFVGDFFQEEKLLAIARFYQNRNSFHTKHPQRFE